MAACTNLATKDELNSKLDSSEKDAIIKTAGLTVTSLLLPKILTAEKTAQTAVTQVTGVKVLAKTAQTTAGASNAAALAASRAAKKASFDALYASSKASAAASSAAKAGGQALKALNLVGSVLNIVGTLVTLGAYAVLASKVQRVVNRVNGLENALKAEKSARNSDVAKLEKALSTTNNNLAKANAEISRANASIAAIDAQISKINTQVKQANSKAERANTKATEALSIGQANQSKIADQDKAIASNTEGIKRAEIRAETSAIDSAIAKQQTQALRSQFAALDSLIKGMRGDISSALQQISTKASEPEVRRVKQATITNASGIKDLNGKTIGLPSLKSNVDSLDKRVTKFEKAATSASGGSTVIVAGIGEEKATEIAKQAATEEGELWYKRSERTFTTKTDFKKVSEELREEIKHTKLGENSFANYQIEKTIDRKTTKFATKTEVQTTVENRVLPLEKMNEQQFNKLDSKLDKLGDKQDLLFQKPTWTPTQIAIAVGSLPILQQILKKKPPTTTCFAPALVPPVGAQAKANNVAILGFQSTAIAQNKAIQTSVNAVRTAQTSIANTLNTVGNNVNKVQSFMQKAWETTRIQKVLDILNTALLIHNAAYLSTNVAASLGDIISSLTNNLISLVSNEDKTPININQTIGSSIENFLIKILGQEAYQGYSETFNKYSRILNSVANIGNMIMYSMAGMAQGLETIGNYTGKIGNALKKGGAVFESSYQWMSEQFSIKTGRLGQIQAVIDGAEQLENVASDLENATQEFREVQRNVTDIQTQFNSVKTSITNKEEEKVTTEENIKNGSRGAQPSYEDYTADNPSL